MTEPAEIIELCLGEGRKIVQSQISAFVDDGVKQGIRVGRGLMLIQYTMMICCFVWALSFFAAAYIVCQQIDQGYGLQLTATLKFCVGAWVVSAVVLYFTLRERTWVRILGFDRRPERVSSGPTKEEVQAWIDQAIEKRMS